MQTREEHIQALQQHFFDKPVQMGTGLGTAILHDKISRKTGHKTVQALIRQWQRYAQTAEELSWKMLAILSFSTSFRQHALVAEDFNWDNFFLHLRDLKISIELVGDFYCSDWRGVLESTLGRSMSLLSPDAGGYHGHHHFWSIPLDREALVAQPVAPYEILEKSVPGANTEFRRDPRTIKQTVPELGVPGPLEEHCLICMKEETGCECPTHIWFSCRVELIQTGNRGTGVRALQVGTPYTKPTYS